MLFGVRVPLNVKRHGLRLAGGLGDGRRKYRPMRLMRHILELCGKVHGTIPKIRTIKLVLSPMEARRACATKLNLSPKNVIRYTIHTSRTRTPAPSPMTNPSRSLLNGLEDRSGWSFREVVRLRDRSKPVNARGWIQDSAPPATITSASPQAMKRAASPIECAPVVQAVLTAWFGPYME